MRLNAIFENLANCRCSPRRLSSIAHFLLFSPFFIIMIVVLKEMIFLDAASAIGFECTG
jgi:hypothetical protein